jgi:nucleotide-binding universal stress UspA family protein
MQEGTSLDLERESTVASARIIFERILVPVDYSMGSHRAVGAALELQRALGSAVCLFHTVESETSTEWLGGIGSPAVQGDWVTRAEARLQRFVENVAPGSAASIELRARIGGETVRLVHDEARRWRATLLIVSAQVRARLFRSPAERLIHDFPVPMLVIPADRP